MSDEANETPDEDTNSERQGPAGPSGAPEPGEPAEQGPSGPPPEGIPGDSGEATPQEN
jgi:hypothetical protein